MFFTQSFNLHTTNNISDVCSNRTHWGNRFFRILLSRNLYPLISFHQNCKHPIKDGHHVSSSFHWKIWSQITWYECCPPVLMMSFQAWDHPLEFEGGNSSEHLPSLNRTTEVFMLLEINQSFTKTSALVSWLTTGTWLIVTQCPLVHLMLWPFAADVMCSWTDQWCDVCEFCMKIQATLCWTVPL